MRSTVIVALLAVAFAAAIPASAATSSAGCSAHQSATAELACGRSIERAARHRLARLHREEVGSRILASTDATVDLIGRVRDTLWRIHAAIRVELAAKARLALVALPWTTDWLTSVDLVQRDWPGSKSWLLSCSASEGGWSYWKWNGSAPYTGPTPPPGSSGAGGWMQYMQSTFNGDYSAALALARSSHKPLPPRSAATWLSALGQAFAAGYAYFYNRPSGKWTGGGC